MTSPAYTSQSLVMERLRLPAGDVDEDYIAECADAANDLVDNYLGRTDPADTRWPPLVAPFPPAVVLAATATAIKLYRGKDATSDVAETWDATLPLQDERPPLAGQYARLAPYRHPREWVPA